MEFIDNKICDIFGDAVEYRKKPLLYPLLVLALGCVILTGAFLSINPNVRFGLMLCGAVVVLASLGVVLLRLFGSKSKPYYIPSGEPLRRSESHYMYESLSELQRHLDNRDFEALKRVRSVDTSNVKIVSYCAPKGGVCACQLMTYVPHEYRPIGEIVVMNL